MWRRSGGFALLIVLWTLVLIAFIVARMTASGRTEIRIAGNLVADAVTAAAGDGARAGLGGCDLGEGASLESFLAMVAGKGAK